MHFTYKGIKCRAHRNACNHRCQAVLPSPGRRQLAGYWCGGQIPVPHTTISPVSKRLFFRCTFQYQTGYTSLSFMLLLPWKCSTRRCLFPITLLCPLLHRGIINSSEEVLFRLFVQAFWPSPPADAKSEFPHAH